MSWPVAHAAFLAHVAPRLTEPLPAVQVLGIDWGHLPLAGATRRDKPVWAKDPVTGRWRIVQDRWHTGIVDAAGTGGHLAHVNGRTATTVADWLIEQPEQWRAGVTHVCIDLSASSLRAVTTALPDAVVVADRFRLVRLANDMLTELRQRVTREARGRRGPKKDPEWACGGGCSPATNDSPPTRSRGCGTG